MRVVENRIAAGVLRVRDALGRSPATSWLIGGAESHVSHTLRQGLLASLLIMVGSWGVGWLAMTPSSLLATHHWLLPLRTTTPGVVLCAVLLTFGALLLLRSWMRLSQRIGHWGPDATRVMYRAAAMWGGPLLLTFPIFSRDVYSYLAQGRVLHAGLNPYESGVSELPGWFMEGADGLWAESPSPYGPLFLHLAQLLWFVSAGIPEVAVALFRLVSVGGILLMLIFIPRLAQTFGSQPSWALWLCLLNPLSLIVFLPASHNDSLMIGLMLAGMWYALRRRRLAAVLLLVAAVAVKPIAMVVVPFAVLLSLDSTRSRLKRVREWSFTMAVVLVLCAVPLAFGAAARGLDAKAWADSAAAVLGWIPASLGAGDAIDQVAPVGLMGTITGVLASWFGVGDADAVAGAFYAGARLVSAGVLTWMLLRPRMGNPVLWAGYGLAVVVLTSSIMQPWYLLWVLPLFAVVHVYRGRALVLITLLLTMLTLLAMVGQLSVAQWIETFVVQVVAVGVACVYLVHLIFFDPNTTALFDMGRRSERWNAAGGWARLRGLSAPAVSWSAAEVWDGRGREAEAALGPTTAAVPLIGPKRDGSANGQCADGLWADDGPDDGGEHNDAGTQR